MKLNVSLSEIISIGVGALVSFGIDILLRSIENDSRQEEISEEVTKQLKEAKNET